MVLVSSVTVVYQFQLVCWDGGDLQRKYRFFACTSVEQWCSQAVAEG